MIEACIVARDGFEAGAAVVADAEAAVWAVGVQVADSPKE
jgi:hypothetical protein